MPRTVFRLPSWLLAVALLAVACSDDPDTTVEPDAPTSTVESEIVDDDPTGNSDDDPDPADPESPTTTESGTETTTSTSTSTTAPTAPSGELASGAVTTADGLMTNWSLSGDGSSLCFRADLSHPDPDTLNSAGDGVSSCLEPAGGLDQLDGGLSVDVGTVDGEKTIGYLWGRVAPEVISLTIEHADGTQTPIEILDGPTEVQVFVYVVEVASIPPVQDLDAVSGTQIEGSAPIRDFLRDGPTYPTVTTTTTTTTTVPGYPVS